MSFYSENKIYFESSKGSQITQEVSKSTAVPKGGISVHSLSHCQLKISNNLHKLLDWYLKINSVVLGGNAQWFEYHAVRWIKEKAAKYTSLRLENQGTKKVPPEHLLN